MVNEKIIWKFFSAFVFVFVGFYPVSGFGNHIISIGETLAEDKDILVFFEPGEQKVVIENHLLQDIALDGINFVGDEFTFPLTVRSFSVRGFWQGMVIKAGTSCSFVMTANQNGSPTLNPNGQPLLLKYKIIGEEKYNNIPFRVKLNYNNHLSFAKREVTLLEVKGEYNKCYVGDLVVINSFEHPIKIKSVKLTKNGKSIGKASYQGCESVKSSDSCKVVLSIDCEDDDIQSKGAVLPIWIDYETLTPSNWFSNVGKNLVTVAAAIIDDPSPTQPVRSVLSGSSAVAAIFLPVLIAGKLGDFPGKSVITNLATGVGYLLGGKIDKKMGYSGKSEQNEYLSSLTLYAALELNGCRKVLRPLSRYAICVLAGLGIRMSIKFLMVKVGPWLFSKEEYHPLKGELPKPKCKLAFVWNKLKPVTDFGAVALLRVVAKQSVVRYFEWDLSGVSDNWQKNWLDIIRDPDDYFDNWQEDLGDIVYDPISAVPLIYFSKTGGPLENNTRAAISIDDACGSECICFEIVD